MKVIILIYDTWKSRPHEDPSSNMAGSIQLTTQQLTLHHKEPQIWNTSTNFLEAPSLANLPIQIERGRHCRPRVPPDKPLYTNLPAQALNRQKTHEAFGPNSKLFFSLNSSWIWDLLVLVDWPMDGSQNLFLRFLKLKFLTKLWLID